MAESLKTPSLLSSKKHGIRHEFSTPKTPQHNEVVERKNKTLQEMAHVMLKANNVPIKF